MKQTHNGSIINMSSQMAITPSLNFGGVHYSAAKGALIAFTKGLAREVGQHKVRVNAVLPGLIETALTRELRDNEAIFEKIIKSTPLRRSGLPEEVAHVCLFLASDLSSYITGEIIAVNGGLPSVLFV